jgi:hypothetical protein
MQTAYVARTSAGQTHHNTLGFVTIVWIGVHALLTSKISSDSRIRIESSDGKSEELPLDSGEDLNDGLLHFPVVNPRKGVTYTVSLKAGAEKEYITVFCDYELYPFVEQSLEPSVTVVAPEMIDTSEVWIDCPTPDEDEDPFTS